MKDIDITKDSNYVSLARRFPEIQLWPMHSFENMQQLTQGGQRFIFNFMLLNGCHACDVAGSATIAFDFDNNGNFLGTNLLSLDS